MKRLFEVNGNYFPSKDAAREARGEPTTEATVDDRGRKIPAKFKHAIKLGPDHWRFRGRAH